mmetsp:Transcript_21032/g.20176  ORF Transcript_21032/g.20176 Transcript_21032/m.20176 type:complete len:213 (-) Transcript_21032:1545-2183(-)
MVAAMEKLYPENRIRISGLDITEKPEISMNKNYEVDPEIWGFQIVEHQEMEEEEDLLEERKIEENFRGVYLSNMRNQDSQSEDHSFKRDSANPGSRSYSKSKNDISSKTPRTDAERIMEIGMKNKLVGSKRNKQNASQVKIKPITSNQNSGTENYKRYKGKDGEEVKAVESKHSKQKEEKVNTNLLPERPLNIDTIKIPIAIDTQQDKIITT